LEGKYSGYEIGNLANSIKGTIAYSNIEIDNVKKGFENIDLDSKYGNVEIDVEDEASYKLKAESEYGNISSKLDKNTEKDGTSKMVEGHVGSDKSTKSTIKLVSKYGNIEVY
jgi:myo-inositol-hexaphosphate 3-phosphohydrolase